MLNLFYFSKYLILIKKNYIKTNKKKVILVGNGGSAAMASHVSVDLTKMCKIRSVNFNEADLITCFSNDYGYENWVQKALSSYADKGDLLICISSSGESKNIINGAKFAKKIGCKVVTLTGFDKKNKVERHQMIYRSLKELMQTTIHALQIKAYSISEYNKI